MRNSILTLHKTFGFLALLFALAAPASAGQLEALLAYDGSAANGDAATTTATDAANNSRGVQLTPNEMQILVSKDLAGARWTVVGEVIDDTVTGNVYEGGQVPAFLWCQIYDAAGSAPSGTLYMACAVSSSCSSGGCPNWQALADTVYVPMSFFLP